jgi:hypothetical protein
MAYQASGALYPSLDGDDTSTNVSSILSLVSAVQAVATLEGISEETRKEMISYLLIGCSQNELSWLVASGLCTIK